MYQGVLPKAIPGNQLIQQGKRMKTAIPQMQFMGTTSPKIERAGTVRRLSPSMNKQRTFVTAKRSKFGASYMCEIATFAPAYKSRQTRPLSPEEQREEEERRRQEFEQWRAQQQEQALQNRQESRKNYDSAKSTYRAGLDTVGETRKWINTANSTGRETRYWLRFAGYGG